MAQNIPPQGIEAYMRERAATLTPENWAWRYGASFRNGGIVFWIFIAALAIVPIRFLGQSAWLEQAYPLAGIVAVAVFLSVALVGIFSRAPGTWHRFSLFQCKLRHQKLGAEAYKQMRALRSGTAADYEMAVLEQDNHCYGAVLFQVVSGDGDILPGGGLPVAVFNHQAKVAQFGDGFHVAPYARHVWP